MTIVERLILAVREECAEHVARRREHFARGYDPRTQPLACNLCSRLAEWDILGAADAKQDLAIGDAGSSYLDPFWFHNLDNPDEHPTAFRVEVKTPWHDGEGTINRGLTRQECERLRDFLTAVLSRTSDARSVAQEEKR